MTGKLHIEYMDLRNLKPNPRNPKRHDGPGIRASIEAFGFADPCVFDERTGLLVCGHGRREVLIGLHKRDPRKAPRGVRIGPGGRWHVPVVRGWRSANDAAADAYMATGNHLTMTGGWDHAGLDAALTRVQQLLDVTTIGFTKEDVERAAAAAAEARALLERQEGERGRSPAELRKGFEEAESRQIVLVFEAREHEEAQGLLDRAREKTKTGTNADAVLALLRAASS